MAAHDTFADAANSGALKILLCGPQSASTPTERLHATAVVQGGSSGIRASVASRRRPKHCPPPAEGVLAEAVVLATGP
jgi:hypothetical protein